MDDFALRAARLLERAAQARARADDTGDSGQRLALLSVADDYEDAAGQLLESDQQGMCSVLIVEDETTIGLMMQHVLEGEGLQCARVTSIARAGLLLRKRRFQGAVLDVNIAGEMVFPLARHLVDDDTPCIFISGYYKETLPPPFTDAPFFQKPFDPTALVEAVLKTVRRGRSFVAPALGL